METCVARPPVLSKADFVERYLAGEFGNASPSWSTVKDLWDWGCKEFGTGENARPTTGLYHLRNRIAGGPTYYNLGWSEAIARWSEFAAAGQKNWYCSMMAPTEETLINGEVQQTQFAVEGRCGLDLYYSRVAKPMRASLLEGGRQVSGIIARLTLEYFLDPSSYDWVMELLQLYPDHVVEFSTYAVNWGTIPGRNTVIWEVRGGY